MQRLLELYELPPDVRLAGLSAGALAVVLGAVVVLGCCIFVGMRIRKRLQAKAGGQLDEAELQRKWQSALRGMRLLLLDSVVRSNKLGDRDGLTKELEC